MKRSRVLPYVALALFAAATFSEIIGVPGEFPVVAALVGIGLLLLEGLSRS